jgi:CheY-like chemotaxis protein
MKASTRNSTAEPARILLVDDNKMGLMARKSVLEEFGYSITTAAEGAEAFDRFRQGNFDLIVTDYRMPKMDGLELIRQVREHAAQTPIILLSGYVEALGLVESNTGADVVISKNANEVPHLIRSVQRLLRRNAPKKPAASQRAASLAAAAGRKRV